MERSECYQYTNKMIKPAQRDNSRIITNSDADIDALRVENARLNQSLSELTQKFNAFVSAMNTRKEEKSEEKKDEKKDEKKLSKKADKVAEEVK